MPRTPAAQASTVRTTGCTVRSSASGWARNESAPSSSAGSSVGFRAYQAANAAAAATTGVRVRVEEPVEPRLEDESVAEREPEVDEGGELEAQLGHSPGEPGEQRALDRPRVGEARAGEEVGDRDRTDGEPHHAEDD